MIVFERLPQLAYPSLLCGICKHQKPVFFLGSHAVLSLEQQRYTSQSRTSFGDKNVPGSEKQGETTVFAGQRMHCSVILLGDSVFLLKPLDWLLKLHQSGPKQKNIISRFSIFEFSEFTSPGRPVAVRSITRRQHDCRRDVLEVGHRPVPQQPPLTVHATQGLCSTNKHLILVDAYREILFFS